MSMGTKNDKSFKNLQVFVNSTIWGLIRLSGRYFCNEGFRKTFIIVLSEFTINQVLNTGKEEKEIKRKAFMI